MKKTIKLYGLGLVTVLSGLFTSCGSDNEVDSFFEDVDLIPVTLSKDGKWSMLNDKGEIVYEDEFKNRPSICYNGVFSVEEGDGYSLYKQGKKGPELVGETENLKCVGYMKENLIPVTFPTKRISILDKNGEQKFELAPIKGSEVVSCSQSFEDGLLYIQLEDGKRGYLDTSGKVAIEPNYDKAYDFSEGLAVVGKELKDSTEVKTEYSVINKKGETVFKIKEGYDLENHQYQNGYLYVQNEDRCILLDKKGEIIKFPAKIKDIEMYNDKYVIFSNDENLRGVANMEGEIIIRPKYERLIFDKDNCFLAVKDTKDQEVVRLDKEGTEVTKLDYEYVFYAGKFGYLAKDGKTISMIDKDGKVVGKNDFYDMSLQNSAYFGNIESDYFNVTAIASTLVGMISPNGVGDVKIDEPASKLLSDKQPSSYSYTSYVSWSDLDKTGFKYSINCQVNLTEYAAKWDYDYSTYSGSYSWNPDSKVSFIALNMSAQNDWGKEGFDAILSSLKSNGWKEYKVGEMNESSYMGILKKGNLSVFVECPKEGKRATVSVAAANAPFVTSIASSITNVISESKEAKDDANAPEVTEEAVAADSVA